MLGIEPVHGPEQTEPGDLAEVFHGLAAVPVFLRDVLGERKVTFHDVGAQPPALVRGEGRIRQPAEQRQQVVVLGLVPWWL